MQLVSTGVDSLGRFTVETPSYCATCDRSQDIVVIYNKVSLKRGLGDIKPEDTVYKGAIGVTCGCYAKLHRQVAHIRDKQNARKSG